MQDADKRSLAVRTHLNPRRFMGSQNNLYGAAVVDVDGQVLVWLSLVLAGISTDVWTAGSTAG